MPNPPSDLEVVRACARVMGLRVLDYNTLCLSAKEMKLVHVGRTSADLPEVYDPLHDKAQCFALVEKFDMVIERETRDRSLFGVTLFLPVKGRKNATFVVRAEAELARAVCLCVYRLHEGKGKA